MGDVERLNRWIEERFRVAFYYLPFKAIPRIMVDNLAMECGYSSNLVPAKGGVSKYFSPHVILKCQALDFNKDFKFSFGDHVEATQTNAKTNNNLPCTILGIYLRPSRTLQGGHEIMDLQSFQKVTRPKVTLYK